ncbi:MAG TPA: MoaD/ThiS family protein [Bacteroidetes bacterium]|nr:MoaD/ThiS family protein [Bacteroidota bacterium]
MQINILAFGIAKDIIKARTLSMELPTGANVAALKNELTDRFPGFQKLKSLAIAVNEEYQTDEFGLSEKDEVVIIPPVSGG